MSKSAKEAAGLVGDVASGSAQIIDHKFIPDSVSSTLKEWDDEGARVLQDWRTSWNSWVSKQLMK